MLCLNASSQYNPNDPRTSIDLIGFGCENEIVTLRCDGAVSSVINHATSMDANVATVCNRLMKKEECSDYSLINTRYALSEDWSEYGNMVIRTCKWLCE